MTSIYATATSNYTPPSLQQLQNDLQQELNSGAISSSDESALSSALNDINSSLQSGSGTGGSSGSGSNSPADLKSKVDSLITNEVSSGKLTQQQATELQNLFQNAFGGGSQGAGGSGGQSLTDAGPISQSALANVTNAGNPTAVGPVPAGAVGGAGAGTLTAVGGIPSGATGNGDGSGGANNSNGTNDSSGSQSANQILQQFLQSLQTSSATAYNANGSSSPIADSSSYLSSFLINYQS